MKESNTQLKPSTLVSDLDGTLIPLPEAKDNLDALKTLNRLYEAGAFDLIFATGRPFGSVSNAIAQYGLPRPGRVICDVGTSIYERKGEGFSKLELYQEQLSAVCGGIDRRQVEALLEQLGSLTKQSEEHQSTFKISYYCEQGALEKVVDSVTKALKEAGFPYCCLGSIDPFSKRGLVDILPSKVNKAYALDWLAGLTGIPKKAIVYAGDSGNDTAALINGYRSILVGNASDRLRSEIRTLLKQKQTKTLSYFAEKTATSGVLEGVCFHGLASAE